jgi:hypothetical protein
MPNPVAEAAAATFAVVVKKFLVFEYLDLDGVPGYQFGGADNITGFYQLGHPLLQWKPLVVDTTVITTANRNITVHVVVWETLDGVYYMRYFLSDFPVTINGIRITPNAAKVDIGIRWFDNANHTAAVHTTGPSNFPNAKVGVLAVVGGYSAGAVIQVDHTNTTTNGSLGITAAGFASAFGYLTQASATQKGVSAIGTAAVRAHVIDVAAASANISVQAAAFQGWTLKIVAFSFDGVTRPQEVLWDPTVGGTPDANAGTTSTTNTGTGATSSGTSTNPTSSQTKAGAAQLSIAFFALVALVALLF